MSGRHHSTRSPHRLSQINARDIPGIIARQRVANADARKVIYYAPHGKSFHKVTNPVSGEVYVVADGLGGATMASGTVAAALSFSGQHGEVLISRPPGGFGGGVVIASTVPPTTNPEAPEEGDHTYFELAMCYSPTLKKAFIARQHNIHIESERVASYLEVASFPLSDLPNLDVTGGDLLTQVAVGEEDESTVDIFVYSMTYHNGAYIIAYWVDNDDERYVKKFSASTGNEMASQQVLFDGLSQAFVTAGSASTCIVAGDYVAVEPVLEVDHVSAGPPFSPNQRLVRRDFTTLAVVNSYTIPRVIGAKAPFANTRYNEILSIYAFGGGVRAFRSYLKQPIGGDDYRVWYQDFDSTLTPGSDVVTTYHSSTDAPFGQYAKMMLGSSSIAYQRNGGFYIGDWDDTTATVLDPYEDDGTVHTWMEPLSSSRFLILGNDNDFLTSIIHEDGTQELP